MRHRYGNRNTSLKSIIYNGMVGPETHTLATKNNIKTEPTFIPIVCKPTEIPTGTRAATPTEAFAVWTLKQVTGNETAKRPFDFTHLSETSWSRYVPRQRCQGSGAGIILCQLACSRHHLILAACDARCLTVTLCGVVEDQENRFRRH